MEAPLQPAAEPVSLPLWQRTRPLLGRGLLFVLALAIVTIGRAGYESRSGLQLGIEAEMAGDLDATRLHYGEARLWRLPLFPWGAEAERRLRELPAEPRAALGGAPTGSEATRDQRRGFGQVPSPSPALALLGGLGLVAALLAAARWAESARRSWAVVTLAGGIITALALWAA